MWFKSSLKRALSQGSRFAMRSTLNEIGIWKRHRRGCRQAADFEGHTGFPNQFFCDSWVVGFWRTDHGWQDIGLERRAWTLAQAVVFFAAVGSDVSVQPFSIAVRSRRANKHREDITMLLTSTAYCLFDGDKSLNKAKRIDRAN
jgi:hypothetical protein